MASSCYDRRHRAIERRHDRVWIADRLRSETRARDRAESVLALMWSMPLSDVDSFPSPLPGENREVVAVVAAMERGLREAVTPVPRSRR